MLVLCNPVIQCWCYVILLSNVGVVLSSDLGESGAGGGGGGGRERNGEEGGEPIK